MKKKIIIIIGIILLVITILCFTLYTIFVKTYSQEIVARYLTDDYYEYTPIVLLDSGEVYVPYSHTSLEWQNTNSYEDLGMLGPHNESQLGDIIFMVGMLHYDKSDEDMRELAVYDDLAQSYLKSEDYTSALILEVMDDFDEFEIVTNDSSGELGNATEPEVELPTIEKELLEESIHEFSNNEVKLSDVKVADEVYYIYGKRKSDPEIDRTEPGYLPEYIYGYVATILEFEGKYYFSNYDNLIEDESLIDRGDKLE